MPRDYYVSVVCGAYLEVSAGQLRGALTLCYEVIVTVHYGVLVYIILGSYHRTTTVTVFLIGLIFVLD
jgi:hypothetical protein